MTQLCSFIANQFPCRYTICLCVGLDNDDANDDVADDPIFMAIILYACECDVLILLR